MQNVGLPIGEGMNEFEVVSFVQLYAGLEARRMRQRSRVWSLEQEQDLGPELTRERPV